MTAHLLEGDPVPSQPTEPTDQPGRGPFRRRVARFAGRHAPLGAVLLVAAAIRVIVLLGFRGALVTPDSADYAATAVRMAPGLIRPSGYPAMLWLLLPLHSQAVVVGVQHAMGLAIGITGYALLRRAGLPGWGAALAMVPVLLSAYAIQIEHFLLSDTLFALLVMLAVAALMWWPDPPLWACGLTGLLLAAATLVRSQGLPLLVIFLVPVLIRRAGWRTIAGTLIMITAFAIPLAGYAGWFDSAHGEVQLTSADGAFFYGAVAPFAQCAKIKPPHDERLLCVKVPVNDRNFSQTYIWGGSPLRTLPGGEFGRLADRLGTDFALRAVRTQPLDYLHAVALSFWESFLPHEDAHARGQLQRVSSRLQDDYRFPARTPRPPAYAERWFQAYDPASPNLKVIQPYARWVRGYQRFIVVSGPLLGVITLIGLGGLIAAWRRIGGPALLPWLTGIALLLAPAAIANFDPRYLVCAVPPLCVAAAIGVQQIIGLASRFRAGRSSWELPRGLRHRIFAREQ